MKIREGFVTNSSSSSFIIALKKDPSSAEELRQMLYGDQEVLQDPYGDTTYPTIKVATTIFNDIKSSMQNSLEEMEEDIVDALRDYVEVDHIIDGKTYLEMDVWNLPREERDAIDWDAHEERKTNAARELFEELKEKHKGSNFYKLEYADEDGNYFCALEHGETFPDDILIARISHH